MPGIYNKDGRIIYTRVDGNDFVGVYNPNGTFNAVDRTGTTDYVGVYHPSGAYNVTVDPYAMTYYNKNGSINVMYNGDGTFSNLPNKDTFRGPLDSLYSQMYAAGGAHRLFSNYKGPCWRVQRASDNGEEDIGFTEDGWINRDWLLEVADGGTLYLVTDYDKSGHERHFTQSTASTRPRVVNSGVIDVGPNGYPAPHFNGTNNFLSVSNSLDYSRAASNLTIALIAKATGTGVQSLFTTLVNTGNSSRAAVAYTNNTTVVMQARQTDGLALVTATKTPTANSWNRYIAKARYSTGFIDLYMNGDSPSTTALNQDIAKPTPNTDSSSNIRIGVSGAGTSFLEGNVGTVLLTKTSVDATVLDPLLIQITP